MADLMPDSFTNILRATILHVEDDPASRYAISRILRREGFTVIVAATGAEGLELVSEGPDLVILDVNLPDLSGFEVCRRIKTDPATATIPVLHLSASHVTDEAQVTGLESGADSYLTQPVDPDVLVATVKALLRMRRAEEKYRSIFENAGEGIFQITLEGRFVTANPALARMFGYGSPKVMMEAISDVGRLFYVDPEQYAEFARLVRDHGSVSGFETQGRRKDGSAIWVSVNAHAIIADGEVVGYEGTVQDVTEHKRAQEAREEIREAERRRMARDLHDVVLQDLSYVSQAMEFTKMSAQGTGLEEELQEEMDTIRRAAQNLRATVCNLHLGEERNQPLPRLLGALVEQNRVMVPGCEIKLDVGGSIPSESSGEAGTEMLRIIQEALTNTRRHSGAKNVLVTLRGKGDRLVAVVTDDGRGFDPTKTAAGMGLKGMRERACTLGGDLKISSKPGEGTKVRFELVLKKDREEPEEEVRILLVEDYASIRQATASVFEREPGFTVVGQAGSLSEARKMLDGVDVAVVDLGLPDGYGGELIKELRDSNPQAQGLVLSAILDRAETARAIESGAAGVLHKSAEMAEIVEAVRLLRAGETLFPLEEVVELLRFAGSRREEEYEARRAIAQLTCREKEILQALAEGLDSREIAERLYISVKTEANHMTSILNKLGVHSRLQALVFAVRHGVAEIH